MKMIRESIRKFAADESGTVSNLMLPLFLLLILTTGWAIDLVMHETERADLQNALDRAVLAAASVRQTQDQQTLAQEYVNLRPLADSNRVATVNLTPEATGVGSRSVRATAIFDFPTIFANIVYHPTYPVPAIAGAQEGVEHVEISLVLDISASMAQKNAKNTTERRISVLRTAAKDFVTALLATPGRQKFSISLVPYSGSVNAGPFFDELIDANGRDHNYSSCIEFEDIDFTYTGLPASNSRGQVPQFNFFRYSGDIEINGVTYPGEDENVWGWCPRNSRGILPFSNSITDLHAAIDAFQGHDGTGTNNGMKWGLALLDPTTQPLIQQMTTGPGASIIPEFANRPASFGTAGVLKIIVLMTDGNIRYQARPRADQLSDPALREYWSQPDGFLSNGSARARNLLSSFQNRQYLAPPGYNALSTIDEPTRTQQFLSLCNLAKTNNVRVFTIGFDISSTSDAFTEMQTCATKQADFFQVEGLDLAAAFNQIKNLVLSLRLTE